MLLYYYEKQDKTQENLKTNLTLSNLIKCDNIVLRSQYLCGQNLFGQDKVQILVYRRFSACVFVSGPSDTSRGKNAAMSRCVDSFSLCFHWEMCVRVSLLKKYQERTHTLIKSIKLFSLFY